MGEVCVLPDWFIPSSKGTCLLSLYIMLASHRSRSRTFWDNRYKESRTRRHRHRQTDTYTPMKIIPVQKPATLVSGLAIGEICHKHDMTKTIFRSFCLNLSFKQELLPGPLEYLCVFYPTKVHGRRVRFSETKNAKIVENKNKKKPCFFTAPPPHILKLVTRRTAEPLGVSACS